MGKALPTHLDGPGTATTRPGSWPWVPGCVPARRTSPSCARGRAAQGSRGKNKARGLRGCSVRQGRTPGSQPALCVVSEKSMTRDLLTWKGGVTSPPRSEGCASFIKGSSTGPRSSDKERSQMRSRSASIFPGGVCGAGFTAACLGEEGLPEPTGATPVPLLTPPARHKTSLQLSGL